MACQTPVGVLDLHVPIVQAPEPTRVRFRYRPHRDEHEGADESVVLELTAEAFLTRYLAHLPQPGTQTLRGYGLYGQRARAALDRARGSLGQAPVIEPEPIDVEDFLARFKRTAAASTCLLCGARLRFVPLLAHGPAPPPLH